VASKVLSENARDAKCFRYQNLLSRLQTKQYGAIQELSSAAVWTFTSTNRCIRRRHKDRQGGDGVDARSTESRKRYSQLALALLNSTRTWGYEVSLVNTGKLCAEMSAIDAAARELCAGLDEEQLSWAPRPGKWSIAQNLAHLRATTVVFLPVVDSVLAECKRAKLQNQGPFRMNLYGHLLAWRMDARPIWKMRAPILTQPQLLFVPAQELEQFLTAQLEMRQRLQNAEGLDLKAVRFPSPLARYLRVNLLEFFSMFNAHSRRHVWQANQVRQALSGPSYRPIHLAR
jgi:DinB superfamily